jgi:hypothetical protein
MTAPATLRPSYATVLRRAIDDTLSDRADVQTACGRTDNLVVLASGISDRQLPVYVMDVVGDQRIGGLGDRRRARVLLAAIAQGNDARDVAEAMTALARQVITPNAREACGLQYVQVNPPSEEDGDPFDLSALPEQWGRSQLVLEVAATVPLT